MNERLQIGDLVMLSQNVYMHGMVIKHGTAGLVIICCNLTLTSAFIKILISSPEFSGLLTVAPEEIVKINEHV